MGARAIQCLLLLGAILAFPPAPADRFPVLYIRGDRVYAAWSAAQGAFVGDRAVLVHGAETVVDTLRVAWVSDDIAALDLSATTVASPLPAPTELSVVSLVPRSGRPEGTLTVPITALPATLDPAHVSSLADKQVGTQIYEGLTVERSGAPSLAAADSLRPLLPAGYLFISAPMLGSRMGGLCVPRTSSPPSRGRLLL